VVRFPRERAEAIEVNCAGLSRLGFEVETYGDGDVAVKGLPRGIAPERAETVLSAALTALQTGGNAIEAIAREISSDPAERIFDGLSSIGDDWTSPRGRKVALRVDTVSIARHFEREP
jgi:hypothetical protein